MVLNDRGMTAWRAVFDTITVEQLPGGMRMLRIAQSSTPIYSRVFTREEAAHLASLLVS